MNPLEVLPREAVNVLLAEGFDAETCTFNNAYHQMLLGYKNYIKTYESMKRFYGTIQGRLFIIGFDYNWTMMKYVREKKTLVNRTPDEIEASARTAGSRIVAYCFNCGSFTYVRTHELNNGRANNCGCIINNKVNFYANRNTYKPATHNLSYSRLFKIYKNMVDRCYNPNDISYPNYGARGIKICSEWYDPTERIGSTKQIDNFNRFKRWSDEHGYFEQDIHKVPKADRLSIDRIDHDGPYSPDNCQWIRLGDQQYNKTNNTILSVVTEQGELITGTIYKLAKTYHKEYRDTDGARINSRINKGWSSYDALTIPTRYTRAKEHCTPLPRDPSTYTEAYDGPRYNSEDGKLRDKDGFIVLDWKVDIRKKYNKDVKSLSIGTPRRKK